VGGDSIRLQSIADLLILSPTCLTSRLLRYPQWPSGPVAQQPEPTQFCRCPPMHPPSTSPTIILSLHLHHPTSPAPASIALSPAISLIPACTRRSRSYRGSETAIDQLRRPPAIAPAPVTAACCQHPNRHLQPHPVSSPACGVADSSTWHGSMQTSTRTCPVHTGIMTV
jgi:hypothetical protein